MKFGAAGLYSYRRKQFPATMVVPTIYSTSKDAKSNSSGNSLSLSPFLFSHRNDELAYGLRNRVSKAVVPW